MGILGSRALLLALLVWPAQGQTVPEHSRPAWDQCQQLSQKLCTLAWSAHPPMGHVELPREGDDETTNEAPHIQCADGCDPQGLRDNSQSCLQRIHQGLVFYEKLLGSDIFTGEPTLLPDGPVGQLQASLLGLRQLLQRVTTGKLSGLQAPVPASRGSASFSASRSFAACRPL
ncbi:interleukin-23 subunit alpha isoform X2 [Manis javanica]|uniref:interleukin-23 subunit alpha isoform X2 n=1 Tax=Manis javanica TaxID=9974 RepID=UPI001879041C|nr:interleukin-23 subunit alpha isoform X2 [Manis javanica]